MAAQNYYVLIKKKIEYLKENYKCLRNKKRMIMPFLLFALKRIIIRILPSPLWMYSKNTNNSRKLTFLSLGKIFWHLSLKNALFCILYGINAVLCKLRFTKS